MDRFKKLATLSVFEVIIEFRKEIQFILANLKEGE